MGSCAAPSAKGDDKFITTDYLQQCPNTCGAAVGGYALDNFGLLSPLALSGGLMLLTALVVAAKVRITPMS